ncbi:MAG: hypothetical protein J6125_03290, partial [Clostridia bacterium]|nr:hypothetical protein [Clostridia bacterium]
MKKAVILGTENMHAISFAEALLDGYLPGVELIGAYGEYEDANDVFRRMGVRLARDPADFVGEADVALATARHGDKHFEQILPYAEAGAILWIDKPFCVSKDKAHALIEAARKSGSLVAGGSFMPFAPAFVRLAESLKNRPADRPLLGGSVVCPVRMEEEFGGFFFYTQHLVEIVLSVFGKDVRSVWASRNGVNVSAICRYDGFDVSCLWHEGGFHYDACVCYPD